MEATELMINDLVQVDGVVRIATIRTGAVYDYMNKEYSIGCIKPIPLTPEILEKNGFEYKTESYLHYHYSIDVFLNTDDGVFMVMGGFLRWVRYVHELQNALRLCGLDELAGNFKI